jgi:hypothetical protein
LNSGIRRPVIFFTALLLTQSPAGGGDFTRTLTPEKMQAAGLAKLTPEELAELETLVQQYKAGEPARAPVPATAVTTAKAPAAPESNQAAKSAKILPAWVGALLTLERIGSKGAKPEAMEGRIKGEFSGWEKRTLFRLENGQVWTQVNDDSYVHAPVLQSPRVKITPASFGTFWMDVEGVNLPCRVKPVRME